MGGILFVWKPSERRGWGEGCGGQGRNLNVWGGEENLPSKGLTGYGFYAGMYS